MLSVWFGALPSEVEAPSDPKLWFGELVDVETANEVVCDAARVYQSPGVLVCVPNVLESDLKAVLIGKRLCGTPLGGGEELDCPSVIVDNRYVLSFQAAASDFMMHIHRGSGVTLSISHSLAASRSHR